MKVLTFRRRSALATRLTAFAIACLLVVPLGGIALGASRSVLPLATLAGFGGYLYFANRAMVLWQGRHAASLRCTDSWRRHFCDERTDRPRRVEELKPEARRAS